MPPAEPAEVRGARSGAERRGAERGKGHRGPSAPAEGCAAPSGSAVPVYRCRGAGLGAGSARAGNNLFPPVSGWEGGEGPSSSSTSFSSSVGAARSSRSSLCAPGCGAASAGRRAAGPALSLPFVCRRSLPTGPRPGPGPWRCSLVPGPAPAAGPALAAAPTPESLCPCPVSPTSVSLPLSLSHILSPCPTAQSLCSHPGSLPFAPTPPPYSLHLSLPLSLSCPSSAPDRCAPSAWENVGLFSNLLPICVHREPSAQERQREGPQGGQVPRRAVQPPGRCAQAPHLRKRSEPRVDCRGNEQLDVKCWQEQ